METVVCWGGRGGRSVEEKNVYNMSIVLVLSEIQDFHVGRFLWSPDKEHIKVTSQIGTV